MRFAKMFDVLDRLLLGIKVGLIDLALGTILHSPFRERHI
jgi:hypothetical protein